MRALAPLLLLILAAPLAGQGALKPFRQATGADELNVVVSAVVKEVSYDIAAAMRQSKPSAWLIQVPDSNVREWKQVRDGLFAAVHGRPMTPADLSYKSIEISWAIVRGDSLLARIVIGSAEYCAPSPTLVIPAGGGWTGTSSEEILSWVRQSKNWMPAASSPGLTVDGGCFYQKVGPVTTSQ